MRKTNGGISGGKRAPLSACISQSACWFSDSLSGDIMKRKEFTKALAKLLLDMVLKGEEPLLDYVKRSDEEQARLFEQGLSKCDGIEKESRHQRGCAADIYFADDKGHLVEPKKGWKYWHDRWMEFGGKPMIDWDKGHFEG